MEALSDVDWETDHFDLRFCTLGKVSDPIVERAKQGPTPVPAMSDFADRCDLTLLDETDLNTALREAISADKEPDTKISVRFIANEEDQPWIRFESEQGRDLYVGQVTGAELSEIYRPNRYKLFAMNIRDYVGDTATNKGMRQTAINKPDEFVFFNNGISAIATQIDPDSEDPSVLHCDRFSIINGAQTVRSLVKAHRLDPASVKGVRVLLRIMRYRYNKDGEFLSDVTRFNNTQNSIKISDFRSNDPVQKDLRNRFAKISVGAKTCDYKNKRRREADSNKFPINMEEFAKTIHSFLWGPDDMFGGTKYLFDISPKGGYQKVFGEPVSHVREDQFEKLAGIYFLCSEVHSIWKAKREAEADEQASAALERRWIVYFAFGELLRMIYERKGDSLDDDLSFLSNPNKWMTIATHVTRQRINEILEMAMTALEQAYGRASVAADFKHRNWFRSTSTLADIRGELKVIPKYRPISDLPTLRR
jgi:hypothetical protein